MYMSSIIIISSQQRIRFTISSLRDGVGLGMGQNEEACWTKLNYMYWFFQKYSMLTFSINFRQPDGQCSCFSK